MKIPRTNRYIVFGLIVVALLALGAAAHLSDPVRVSAGQQAPSPTVAAVSSATRACAGPGLAGSRNAGLAVVAAAGGSGSGRATISRLATPGSSAVTSLSSLTQPGTLDLSSVSPAPGTGGSSTKAGSGTSTGSNTGSGGSTKTAKNSTSQVSDKPIAQAGGVLIQASGTMAQGLEAEQTSAGTVTAACGSPGTDFWFTLPGEVSASSIKLYLMNSDAEASTVNVGIVTDTGPLQGGTDNGLSVPAHGLVVQSLSGLLRNSRAIGLHVSTSAGQVVAAVSVGSSASQPGAWVPAGQAPAKELVIPAMPGNGGSRELYVADPGTSDASVTLSVVTPGGTYEPTGGSSIDIPAGSASRIELPSLGGVTGAAVLKSKVPVTASLLAPGGPSGSPGALAAAAPAVTGQGVVADVRSGAATLVLSAPGKAARVRLGLGTDGLTGSGHPASTQVISIPAKRSVTVNVPRPSGLSAKTSFAVVLTPLSGSGPVYAGRVLQQGSTVLSIMAVTSAPVTVPLPPARGSVLAVAP